MPATDYHHSHSSSSSSSSPFSAFGRSLLSLRRDAAPTSSSSTTMPPPTSDEDAADLDAFQRHLTTLLTDLLPPGDGDRDDDLEFMSAAWIHGLLHAFLACQDEFRAVLSRAASSRRQRGTGTGTLSSSSSSSHQQQRQQYEKMVAEFGERAVKALDVCNAARDGVDQVRRWERLAANAASVLLTPTPGAIHEGQLRRARKALADLIDDAGTGGASPRSSASSFLASHRNRSFGRGARASPSRASSSSHFRSLSWSVSRTWSAARQLQSISAGMTAPRAHDPTLQSATYAMGCLLHLAAWALVAAVPCPDRAAALQQPTHHVPPQPPRAAFLPWAPPLLALQERLAEEGKRRDRRGAPGLLREIHALERAAQRLAEVIDASPVPLTADREAEVREAAAELAAVCAAIKHGLEPLERQVREVFHRIVRSRMEGLDSPPTMINGD